MKQRRKSRKGYVQGHALLYGRSSKAIRIVFGEVVGKKEDRNEKIRRAFPKIKQTKKQAPKKQELKRQAPKKHKITEDTIKKLETLKDPLEMMSKYSRAQKYEASQSDDKYEYGLSDW